MVRHFRSRLPPEGFHSLQADNRQHSSMLVGVLRIAYFHHDSDFPCGSSL